MSAFLETITFNTLNLSKHKTGRYVRALYARGRGRHCTDIRSENSSSKLNLNLSVWLSKLCFRTEPAIVMNLFQNGYPSTLIDMLMHSVWLPEHCFQFKYIEFHSNWKTFNVGRAYYCQLISVYNHRQPPIINIIRMHIMSWGL